MNIEKETDKKYTRRFIAIELKHMVADLKLSRFRVDWSPLLLLDIDTNLASGAGDCGCSVSSAFLGVAS